MRYKIKRACLTLACCLQLFAVYCRAWASGYHVLYSFGMHSAGSQNMVFQSRLTQPESIQLIKSGPVLYGTSSEGGMSNCGTIFSYNLRTGKERVLHSFGWPLNKVDLSHPTGAMVKRDSTLYGVTAGGSGGIFSYNLLTGAETILHSFTPAQDGAEPVGSLVQSGLVFYGLTSAGGGANAGTIFSCNVKTGAETLLHSFVGNATDRGVPTAAIIKSGSTLYGVTSRGGTPQQGTIFSFNIQTGTEKVLHIFGGIGHHDGANPSGSLLRAGSMLYGLTASGGYLPAKRIFASGGTLFSYDLATGKEKVLYGFGTNALSPFGNLVLSGSTLYGTAFSGGQYTGGYSGGDGSVFGYNLATGVFTIVHAFDGPHGANPLGGLLLSHGIIYGMTSLGGIHGHGVIFSLTVPHNTAVK